MNPRHLHNGLAIMRSVLASLEQEKVRYSDAWLALLKEAPLAEIKKLEAQEKSDE
jgi:hypothetical protein